jgi:hypothetical protein
VFTPTSSSEVGTSQRHDGKWDTTSAYRISNTLNVRYVILIYERYVRIDGIQVDFQKAPNDPDLWGIRVFDDHLDAPTEFHFSNNIIRMTYGTPATNGARGIMPLDQFQTADNGLYIAKVWNNIVYGFRGDASSRGIVADNYGTVYAYNNTVIGDSGVALQSYGINGSATGLFYAKNNISIDYSDPYINVIDGVGSNNNASDTGDAPGANPRNCEPTFMCKRLRRRSFE